MSTTIGIGQVGVCSVQTKICHTLLKNRNLQFQGFRYANVPASGHLAIIYKFVLVICSNIGKWSRCRQ